MRLQGLMTPLIESREFNEISNDIDNKKFPSAIYGLSESGRTYLIDALFENYDRSLVVVTHSDIEAKKFI